MDACNSGNYNQCTSNSACHAFCNGDGHDDRDFKNSFIEDCSGDCDDFAEEVFTMNLGVNLLDLLSISDVSKIPFTWQPGGVY